MLSLTSISKRFPPDTVALHGASLEVRGASVHALLGENGAGKTTLVRIAFGMERPDEGEVRIDGALVHLRDPADAIARGIGMVHQHVSGVPTLTVAENVALGGRGLFDVGRMRARVREIGAETGLLLDPDAEAGALPLPAQSRLEIVKALERGARTLILDEPTALLAPREAADLLAALGRLARGGTAIVLITHKLREALAVADDITVLRGGRTVLRTRAADTDERTLAAAMLGTSESGDRSAHVPGVSSGPGAPPVPAGTARPPAPSRTGQVTVVRASNLTVADESGTLRLRGATLELRGGEIVGVAGVEGSGHRELLRALAGRLPVAAGELAASLDVAFIPEDRQGEGLLPHRPLYENVALRDAVHLPRIVPWRTIAARTAELLARFDVRAPGAGAPARALSGGNQQKVVLARELDGDPELIVAENPTRGLDVGAQAFVHGRLRSARDRGSVVVIHSTDLDELIALSDRVLVTHGGELLEVAVGRDAIGDAMLGVRAPSPA